MRDQPRVSSKDAQTRFALNSVRNSHITRNQNIQAEKRAALALEKRDSAHAQNYTQRYDEELQQECAIDEEDLIRLAETHM